MQERETLAEGIETLHKQLDGYMRQYMDSLRHRVQLFTESYPFQRPTEPLRQLAQRVDELTMREEQAARTLVQHVLARVERVGGAVALLSPTTQVCRGWESLREAGARLKTGCAHCINMLQGELETAAGKLDSLSPLAVLARGYSLAWKLPEETLLRDARALAEGDAVRIQLHKGSALLSVDEVHPTGD